MIEKERIEKERIEKEQIVLFGAGIDGRKALDFFGVDKVLFFVDNSIGKVGKKINGVEIISFKDFVKKEIDCSVVITVDIRFIHVIARQLEENGFINYVSFYEIRNNIKKSDFLYFMYRENDLNSRFSWLLERSEITKIKPAGGYLRNKQLKLLEFCKRFFDEIAMLDIHPFLNGGSLIGAIRHGGFVPWDDDIDFGIMRDDYNRLIEYAKKNCVVGIKTGRLSEYDGDAHMSWIDKMIRQNPEQYVFVIETDLLQVNYGTSCIDRAVIDFFVFDYYDDNYKAEDHKEYIKYILQKKREIDYIDKIVEFLKSERENNPDICDYPTNTIFPGLDYPIDNNRRADRISYFLKREDFFPLRKIRFEDTYLYAPNSPDKLSELEYPGFMSYPDDAGRTTHLIFREKYMSCYLPSVDFYVGCFENVSYFEPLYDYFEHKGVYARYLILKEDYINDKEKSYLVEYLEQKGVRYYMSLYSDSDCVLFEDSFEHTFESKYTMSMNGERLDDAVMERIRDIVINRWRLKEKILKFDSI